MGADIHMRAEVRYDGVWHAIGRVFDSSFDHGPYLPATRENLGCLTDGQLLDAFAWQGRSLEQVKADKEERLKEARKRHREGERWPFGSDVEDLMEFNPEKDDYYRELRQRFSPEAQEVFREFNERRDEYLVRYRALREEWQQAIKDYETEHGGTREPFDPVPEPVSYWKYVQPRERAMLRELRDAVTLAPGIRENIVTVLSEYRYEDASNAEDSDYGGLDISFELAENDPPHKTVEPFHDRNYNLFGVLANVRNGGYQDEPQRVKPIDDPRGRPIDIAEETDTWLDRHGDHSDSYMGLDELEGYDWDNSRIDHWGLVTEEQYLEFRDELKYPTSWSGGVSGAGIRTFTPEGYEHWVKKGRPYIPEAKGRSWLDPDVHITPELVDALLVGEVPMRAPWDDSLRGGGFFAGEEAPTEVAWGLSGIRGDATGEIVAEPERTVVEKIRPYVRIEWVESSHQIEPRFTEYTLPALRALVPDGGTKEDVRIVFNFDS